LNGILSDADPVVKFIAKALAVAADLAFIVSTHEDLPWSLQAESEA
jgi:hypothetical protein